MTVAAAWEKAGREAERLKALHLRELFAKDPERFTRFSSKAGDLLADFSKEKIDAPALAALLALAEAAEVPAKREAMFRGEPINLTENRAVLHVAARDPYGDYTAPGFAEVAPTLDRFLAFAEAVRSGAYAPPTGGRFTDVINIGIGGSDLGPAMAVRALAPDHDGPRIHFVSNVDGAHLTDVIQTLDPAQTLVIVASKTFTTLETMTNAMSARAWLAARLGDSGANAHLAAVSTNLQETAKFGVDDSRVFGFWDWIGGRYSVWTAIGLPLAIAVGAEDFRSFLAGAKAMDDHFRHTPLAENLPVLMGLLGIWRRDFLEFSSVAVIPYDERLGRLPAYLQQLTMESNGKRVTRGGESVKVATCPVVWGEAGTNAQHSFFQLIHLGTDVIPVDFLVAAEAHETLGDHHVKLLANCFAQSQALAFGKTPEEVAADMRAKGQSEAEIARLTPHRSFPGDRPSTTLLYPLLTPFMLGGLIALYEHKTFVEAAIWDVNAFDQWGVELGKDLAVRLLPFVESGAAPAGADSSTAGLLAAAASIRHHDEKGA